MGCAASGAVDVDSTQEAAVQEVTSDGPAARGSSKGRRRSGAGWDEWLRPASPDVTVLAPSIAIQNSGGANVIGAEPLPTTGQHYWEVCFEYPGMLQGESMGSRVFAGVISSGMSDSVSHGLYSYRRKGSAAWGLSQVDLLGQRIMMLKDGREMPQAMGTRGALYRCGERIGILADMDARPRTLHYYRDGERIPTVEVSGFPELVCIAACPFSPGSTVCAEAVGAPEDAAMLMTPDKVACENDDLSTHVPASETEDSFTFELVLSKRWRGEELGVDLAHMESGKLKVVELRPAGALERVRSAGSKRPGNTVQVGDTILRVNAATDAVGMVKEVGASQELRLLVSRHNTLAARPSGLQNHLPEQDSQQSVSSHSQQSVDSFVQQSVDSFGSSERLPRQRQLPPAQPLAGRRTAPGLDAMAGAGVMDLIQSSEEFSVIENSAASFASNLSASTAQARVIETSSSSFVSALSASTAQGALTDTTAASTPVSPKALKQRELRKGFKSTQKEPMAPSAMAQRAAQAKVLSTYTANRSDGEWLSSLSTCCASPAAPLSVRI